MGQQQGHRIRFIETSEIKEVTVLAERPLAISVMGGQRGRRDHRRSRTELIEETLPPAGVDAGVEIVHARRGLGSSEWQLSCTTASKARLPQTPENS